MAGPAPVDKPRFPITIPKDWYNPSYVKAAEGTVMPHKHSPRENERSPKGLFDF